MGTTSTRRAVVGWSWRAAGVALKFQKSVIGAATPERHQIGAVDILLRIHITVRGRYVSRFEACQRSRISPRAARLVAVIALGSDFAKLIVDRDALTLQLPGVDQIASPGADAAGHASRCSVATVRRWRALRTTAADEMSHLCAGSILAVGLPDPILQTSIPGQRTGRVHPADL